MHKTIFTLLLSFVCFVQHIHARASKPTKEAPVPPASLSATVLASHIPSFYPVLKEILPCCVSIVVDCQVSKDAPISTPSSLGALLEDFFKDFVSKINPALKHPIPDSLKSRLGSGFITEIDGDKIYILTAAHVVSDQVSNTKKISVFIAIHEQNIIGLEATIKGIDTRTDLVVLEVDLSSDINKTVNAENKQLIKKYIKPVHFGNSDDLHVGDLCLAIGSPFGLGNTATNGMIGALNREIRMPNQDLSTFDFTKQGNYFIQHNAAINFGNSGGPLFNIQGEVIGVNTSIYSAIEGQGNVGIGFATPSQFVKPVYEQLRKHGKIQHGWMGVRTQPLNDKISKCLGLKNKEGVIVTNITHKSPAALATSTNTTEVGLRVKDVILKYNGETIKNNQHLSDLVAKTPIQTTVPVKVWRNQHEIVFKADITSFEEAQKIYPELEEGCRPKPILGMIFESSDISMLEGDIFEGLVIAQVISTPALEAYQQGLLIPQDIIKYVTYSGKHQDIKTIGDFQDAILEAKQTQNKDILLFVVRKGEGGGRFIPLSLEEDSLD